VERDFRKVFRHSTSDCFRQLTRQSDNSEKNPAFATSVDASIAGKAAEDKK